ncbi:hypothetical protein TWF281_008594 [Arthrobotrys megalospora]
MFNKSISLLFSLLALVSFATAIPFNPHIESNNAQELSKRATCNADNLLRLIRSQGDLGKAMCRSWLDDGSAPPAETGTGGTKTVTVATELTTTTWTKSLISTKTVYTTVFLAATTNTKSLTVTSTTTVTATQTVVMLKAAKAKVRKDKIAKRAASKVNFLDAFTAYPARLSSACSCILTTATPKPAATPTATVSVTATSTINVDTTVFIISTATSTITQSSAAVEVTVTDTVFKTQQTVVTTRVWVGSS